MINEKVFNASIFHEWSSQNKAQEKCDDLNASLPWTRFSFKNDHFLYKYKQKNFWLSTDINDLAKNTGIPTKIKEEVSTEMQKSVRVAFSDTGKDCVYVSWLFSDAFNYQVTINLS